MVEIFQRKTYQLVVVSIHYINGMVGSPDSTTSGKVKPSTPKNHFQVKKKYCP